MNSRALYHREVGLPASVGPLCGVDFLLQYTKHAMRECLRDLYSPIRPPQRHTITASEIIEVETDSFDHVVKLVIRIGYNSGFDLILVMLPSLRDRVAVVKTCWLNRRTDTHRSLDRSRYSIPGETPVA